MRVLITGIAGFVGSTLAREFLKINKKVEIIGVDNLSFGSMNRIGDIINEISFFELDVKDISNRLDVDDVDAIIHCAAIAPLPDNQIDPFKSLEQNVAMCGAISEFATKIGCRNIVFFSSGAVYEGAGEKACKESDEIRTKLIYPTSKFLAEKYFESISASYGLKVVAIRLFNLYGPNQDYFRKQPPLLGYLLKSYIKKEEITLYASENAKRDYIYIDDLFNLIQNVIHKFEEIEEGSFMSVNAGGGYTYSVYDIVAILEKVTNEKIAYKRGEKKEFWNKYPAIFERSIPLKKEYLLGEVDKVAIADIDMAKKYFEWTPKVSMEEGLSACLEFAKGVVK